MARRSDLVVVRAFSAANVRLSDQRPGQWSRDAVRVGRALAWQERAMEWHDLVPEFGFVTDWYGDALARLVWGIGIGDDREDARDEKGGLLPGVEREALDAAEEALENLRGRNGLHSEWARAAGRNVGAIGEVVLLGYWTDEDGRPVPESVDPSTGRALPVARGGRRNEAAEEEVWDAVSPVIVSRSHDGTLAIQRSEVERPTVLPGDTTVVTIRNPHPRWPDDAWAPAKGLDEVFDGLVGVERAMHASALSRTHAGILLVPEEGLGPSMLNSEGNEPPPIIKDLIAGLTAPGQNPGSSALLVPTAVVARGDSIAKWRHVALSRDFDGKLIERATWLLRRLAQGLDVPPEVILGLSNTNHWCVDIATEILTTSGWKRHDEVVVGEPVLTLNHETGCSEWQPVLALNRFDVDEDLVEMETTGHSSLTTSNHRWPVLTRAVSATDGRAGRKVGVQRPLIDRRDWVTSGDLNGRHRIIRRAPHADVPAVPKYSDAFVELMAWLWTDGSVRERPGRLAPAVMLHQSSTANSHLCARIRNALTSLYGPATEGPFGSGGRAGPGKGRTAPEPRWREMRRANGLIVFKLNQAAAMPLAELAPGRMVSLDFIRQLTESQLLLFLETSVDGDGSRMSLSGTRVLMQKDPAMLDAAELAAVLAGFSTNRYSQWVEGFGHGRHLSHYLTIGTRTTVRPGDGRPTAYGKAKVRRKPYVGTVWCPTTANGTWMARRHGTTYFTGNSSWLINENGFRHHIEPMALLIADGITMGYLWPAMMAAGISREVARRFRVRYDPSDLILNPDRSADAVDAFKLGLLSASAAREHLRFPETEAPTEDELRLRSELGFLAGSVDRAIDAPRTEKAPPAREQVVAAAAPDLSALSDALGVGDAALLATLVALADAAVDDALRSAGSRLRSRAQKDATLKALVTGVDPQSVPGVLGQRQVYALLGDDSVADLFSDAFARVRERWRQLMRSGADLFDALLRRFGFRELDEIERAIRAGNFDDAERVLEDGLRYHAEALLLGGAVTVDGAGELPAGLLHPPSAAERRALARAGGSAVEAGTAAMEHWSGGLLAGPQAQEALATRGVVQTGFRWVYGSAPRTPFPPHLALSGQDFTGPRDPKLSTGGTFGSLDFWRPGDHQFCACTSAPLLTSS